MAEKARNDGQDIEPNARGMVYNADMVSLIKFQTSAPVLPVI